MFSCISAVCKGALVSSQLTSGLVTCIQLQELGSFDSHQVIR